MICSNIKVEKNGKNFQKNALGFKSIQLNLK